MKVSMDSTLTLRQIFEVLDEPWLYDLLPGDGQDDFILKELRGAFKVKVAELADVEQG